MKVKIMDYKLKLVFLIILIISIALSIVQIESTKSIGGTGSHRFISGSNVDCIMCHSADADFDMNLSQIELLNTHKRAAANNNYTTYLQVGGISYDPVAGIISTNVDSDNSGSYDTWIWNGAVWEYNNIEKLYDLDFDKNDIIEGSEMCRFCHNLELMGINTAASEVHTVGIRYCDDDRCHGNIANQYNSYLLFTDAGNNVTNAGKILSDSNVHGTFYNVASNIDSNNSIFFKSYGQVPGNAAHGNVNNISGSPYTCLGCHSYMDVIGSNASNAPFNHSDTNPPKGRYN